MLLKPNNYSIPGYDHDDISPYDIQLHSSAEYIDQLQYQD